MRVVARVVGRRDVPDDQWIVVDHAQLLGADYSGRKLEKFASIGSRFERCNFDNAIIVDASFGSGKDPSEFLECTFNGAQMNMNAGGYARFVRCSFRESDLRNWICFAVELVDCTFSGKLRMAIFNGSVTGEYQTFVRRDRNEFHGNDFSGMKCTDLTFRRGIDLSKQRLPSGPEYLYLPDAAVAIDRAFADVVRWKDPSHQKRALNLLNVLKEDVQDGQRQLLLRARDFYRKPPHEAVDRVFELLARER
jgi:hypothetical protein